MKCEDGGGRVGEGGGGVGEGRGGGETRYVVYSMFVRVDYKCKIIVLSIVSKSWHTRHP